MSSILKTLRLVADPTRIRILSLLRQEELSVVELQEILAMGQSRISSQLSQLKQVDLVDDRRAGKNIIYRFQAPDVAAGGNALLAAIDLAAGEVPEIEEDRAALAIALSKRTDKARAYFDQLAGKFGRTYCPGRSWKSLSETLLKLLPPLVIADLGAGEGTFSQLLAQRAELVIAVDNSEKMVEFGASVAKENGFTNLEYRLGDIEDPPIDPGTIDLAFFSQALHHAQKPRRAIERAFTILKPGGRIVILDLLKHGYEDARELYADVWLGFSELEIADFLENAGFGEIDMALVDREKDSPHFQTLMAIATKPT
ncbi:MAG: metalloregulator ArsR/SmtB family transcription factor [Verrucomicrobiae bacterium]|nr:metalloregulator ArsR/SmtB family transcription factor [Verrucomicrobiae bacterium]